jgi:hypothetical protein
MYKVIRRYILIVLAGLGGFTAAPASRADEALRPKVAEIAEGIKKILESRQTDTIAVGEFNAPAGHAANYGPGIQDLLSQELKSRKIRVDAKAGYKVQGDFVKALVKDVHSPSDVLVLKLNFRIYDNQGEELTSLTQRFEIRNNAVLAKALGYTGPLSPKGDYYVRNQDLQRNLGEKGARIDGSRIFAGSGGLFAIEILARPRVQTPAKPRQPQIKGNEAFVGIGRGELYEVRLYNYSKLDAAVTLQIDGLNTFAFSDVCDAHGAPKYQYYIVPPSSNTVIPGWHKRNDGPNNYLSFLVTAYGEGASRHAPQPTGKIGIITATFAYAWSGNTKPAEEEGTRDGGNETGFGPPVTQQATEVQRHIGVVRDVISVRYSRGN